MDDSRWKDVYYKKYQAPPQSYIESELAKYEKIVEQFCQTADFDRERVECNIQTLKDIIVRIDMRQLYFRMYHSDMVASEYKVIMGLSCFWILKLRPFWVKIQKEDSPEVMQIATWINEKIALYMACCLLEKYNPDFFENGKNLCKSYCKELEYSFRYRDLSKESMFLMFDPFYFICQYNSEVSKDGRYIL